MKSAQISFKVIGVEEKQTNKDLPTVTKNVLLLQAGHHSPQFIQSSQFPALLTVLQFPMMRQTVPGVVGGPCSASVLLLLLLLLPISSLLLSASASLSWVSNTWRSVQTHPTFDLLCSTISKMSASKYFCFVFVLFFLNQRNENETFKVKILSARHHSHHHQITRLVSTFSPSREEEENAENSLEI